MATAFPEELNIVMGNCEMLHINLTMMKKGEEWRERRGEGEKRTMQRFVFILAHCQGSMTLVHPFSKLQVDIKVSKYKINEADMSIA